MGHGFKNSPGCNEGCCEEPPSTTCTTAITSTIAKCNYSITSIGIRVSMSFSAPNNGNNVSSLLCEPTGTPGEFSGSNGTVDVTVVVEPTPFNESLGLHYVNQYRFDGPAGNIVATRINTSGHFLVTGFSVCPSLMSAAVTYERTKFDVQTSGTFEFVDDCSNDPHTERCDWLNNPVPYQRFSSGCTLFNEMDSSNSSRVQYWATINQKAVIEFYASSIIVLQVRETAIGSRDFTDITFQASGSSCFGCFNPDRCCVANGVSVTSFSEYWDHT